MPPMRSATSRSRVAAAAKRSTGTGYCTLTLWMGARRRQRAELVGAEVDVQAGQRQAGPRQQRRDRRRHARGNAEAVPALPVGRDQTQAHTRAGGGGPGEADDLAHLLDAVGDDGGPLGERSPQLGGRLQRAVEDDLRTRHARPAGDAILEPRGHLRPTARSVQPLHHAHQGVGLDRVGDGRPRPGHGLERPGLGLHARPVEHIEGRAETLRQLRRTPRRARRVDAGHRDARRVGAGTRGGGGSPAGKTRPDVGAHPRDLLQVGVPRRDDQVDPGRAIFVEQRRDARVGADQRGPRPAADRADARPQARRRPSVAIGRYRVHPRLADAVEARVLLRAIAGDLGPRQELPGRGGRLTIAGAGDDVDAQAEADRPLGPPADIGDACRDTVGRLAPHQVGVGDGDGQRHSRLAGASEVERPVEALAHLVDERREAA